MFTFEIQGFINPPTISIIALYRILSHQIISSPHLHSVAAPSCASCSASSWWRSSSHHHRSPRPHGTWLWSRSEEGRRCTAKAEDEKRQKDGGFNRYCTVCKNEKQNWVFSVVKCSLRTSTKGRLFRSINSYSFNFNGFTGFCPWHLPSPGGKQFLWFWQMTFRNFTAFYSFWFQGNACYCFFQMCISSVVIQLICVQIWFILMRWILVSVALKKW